MLYCTVRVFSDFIGSIQPHTHTHFVFIFSFFIFVPFLKFEITHTHTPSYRSLKNDAKQNADEEAIAVNHDFNEVTPPKKFGSSPVRK
jgi:hypothetical protein